jgi:5-formyltetrahydrofolate cyclo-ligase
MLTKRMNLTPQEIQAFERNLIEQIKSLPPYQKAKHIGLFMPIKNEPNLLQLIDLKKTFYFPKVQGDTLIYLPWKPKMDLETSMLGISEPKGNFDQSYLLDLVIIPALAIDQKGHRLGFGKGYFDRFLSKHRPPLVISVIYPFQKITHLEPEAHDQTVDLVLVAVA